MLILSIDALVCGVRKWKRIEFFLRDGRRTFELTCNNIDFREWHCHYHHTTHFLLPTPILSHPSTLWMCMRVFVFAGRFRPYPLSRIYTVDCPPHILYSNFCLPASPIMIQPTASQPFVRSFVRPFIAEQLSHSHCHRALMPISTPFTANTFLPTQQPSIFLNSFALLCTRSTFFLFNSVHVFVFICSSIAHRSKYFMFCSLHGNAVHISYIY